MSDWTSLRLSWVLLTVTGLTTSPCPLWGAPPNVVVILADDLGYSDLGSYGGEIRTPNLDALAREGVRFTQFYTTPRCSPTRAALLTGRYPHAAGVGHLNLKWRHPGYQGELSREAPTVAERLTQVGYSAYMTGKWHLSHNPSPHPDEDEIGTWPLGRGFRGFYGTIRGSGSYFDPATLVRDETAVRASGEGYYYTDAISTEATRFLDRHHGERPEKPFFLYVAYTAPHWPLHARPPDIAAYRGLYDAGWEALRPERHRRMRELGIVRESWPLAPADPRVPRWSETRHKEWQARRMEVYAAMVQAMDRGIGQIVRSLEAHGALEDTLLIFFSDNGANAEELRGLARLGRYFMPLPETANPFVFGDDAAVLPGPATTFQTVGPGWANLSNTPFRLYKHFAHEGGIATPFIAHWPAGISLPRGSLVHAPGHVVDIAATLVELAGGGLDTGPRRFTPEGQSLLPLLRGERRQRGALFWEHEGNRAVREGRWKLVRDWPGPWELYDLEKDRTELHDLARQEPERVRRLAALYEAWAKSHQVGTWPLVVPYVTPTLAVTVAALVLAHLWLWRRRRARLR